jgi:hypothetical protein
MGDRRTPMDPGEAERRFAELLDQAGLPRFASTFHDRAVALSLLASQPSHSYHAAARRLYTTARHLP